MKTVYPTKIGLELVIPLSIVFIATTMLFVWQKLMFGLTINAFTIAFIVYLFTSIEYVINDKDLIVRCGFFYSKKIAIQTIIEINATRNPISSPATSLDRLEIVYNNKNTTIISPKDKQVFVQHILSINKNIVVNAPKQKSCKT